MDEFSQEIRHLFGNKLRVRVCGIYIKDNSILLINHRGIGNGDFWNPPGGGVKFGESSVQALQREFLEETGLLIEVGKFLFVNEFIGPSLHAIELFFEVHYQGGNLTTGIEPEASLPIIQDVKFLSWEKISGLADNQKHNLFNNCQQLEDILTTKGYLQYKAG